MKGEGGTMWDRIQVLLVKVEGKRHRARVYELLDEEGLLKASKYLLAEYE